MPSPQNRRFAIARGRWRPDLAASVVEWWDPFDPTCAFSNTGNTIQAVPGVDDVFSLRGKMLEPRAQQAAVEIPADWKNLVWPRLRQLASQITDVPIRNRDDADRAIEQELKRRAVKPDLR